MNIIVAIDSKYGIGKNNSLLTHIPEDMKFFKEMTMNTVVIMGRKTLESFPNKKPLPNRINIVISSQKLNIEGVICVNCIEDAVVEANKYNMDIFIIGGSSIYSQFIDKCDTLYITKIYEDFNADTFFPKLDTSWSQIPLSDIKQHNNIKYQFFKYTKNK